ncbi:MAG: cupredoxin domain-containing protein [Acidobacteriota bacterium]|nr:cupredoxin domain-containing protein [Acidobacteriota bacterium]
MKRALTAGVLLCLAAAAVVTAQSKREFAVHANRFAFTPSRIDVAQDDMVKVTFTADDIAHSFTIDEYRIAKRADAGQTVTFEFRADRPGTHRIYCNLTNDDGCRRMHGELVVRGR